MTEKDHTIPERRQRRLAAEIPGAEVFTAPGGHAPPLLDAARWIPVFLEAVESVTCRIEVRPNVLVAPPGNNADRRTLGPRTA